MKRYAPTAGLADWNYERTRLVTIDKVLILLWNAAESAAIPN